MRLFVRCFILFLGFSIVSFSTYSYSTAVAQETEAEEDKSPKMDSPVISPDGTHIAFLHGSDGEELLVSWNLVTNEQTAMQQPERFSFSWYYWANNDKLLLGFNLSNSEAHLALQNDINSDDDGNNKVTATRLYSIDKSLNMDSVVNLFKLIRTDVPHRYTRQQYANMIAFQDEVIDILPNDPDHILLNIDDDLNELSEVRKVNINDASSELFRRERIGIQYWKTDASHQVRYGSEERSLGKVTRVATRAGVTIKDLDEYDYYLNPKTNDWGTINNQSWATEGGSLISFHENPRLAYIITADKSLILHDLVADQIVQMIADNYNYVLYSLDRPIMSYEVIGYVDEDNIYHYFDANFQSLHETIESVFPNNFNRIVSMAQEVGKFIVFSRAEGQSGAYYLLDMQKGSLDKLMDRY